MGWVIWMFVKSIMIPKFRCHVVQHTDNLQESLRKLEQYDVDGLPVLNEGKYAGVITRYGIYKRYFESVSSKEAFLENTLAMEVCTHQEDVLKGDEFFEKTLVALKDFPILAVVDKEWNFLGAVTRSDVVEQFKSAFGMQKPGVRIAFTTAETEGRLARLSEIAHQYKEHIISIVTFDESDTLVRRIVMKIEKKSNIEKFVKKLEAAGFGILSISDTD